jgi:ribulose kinase
MELHGVTANVFDLPGFCESLKDIFDLFDWLKIRICKFQSAQGPSCAVGTRLGWGKPQV